MAYNFSKLLGRMKENSMTQADLANGIGISGSTLNAKLKNKYPFTADEIENICAVLDISNEDIGIYFFCKQSLEQFKT